MVDRRMACGPCSKGTGMGQPCLIARYSQVGCLVIQELELIRREGHEHIHKGLPPPWNIPDRLHLLTLAHWRPDFCAKVVENKPYSNPSGWGARVLSPALWKGQLQGCYLLSPAYLRLADPTVQSVWILAEPRKCAWESNCGHWPKWGSRWLRTSW